MFVIVSWFVLFSPVPFVVWPRHREPIYYYIKRKKITLFSMFWVFSSAIYAAFHLVLRSASEALLKWTEPLLGYIRCSYLMKIAILDFLPGHRIAPLLTSFAESNLILHGVVSVLAIHLNLRNLPEICKITRKFFSQFSWFLFHWPRRMVVFNLDWNFPVETWNIRNRLDQINRVSNRFLLQNSWDCV